MRLGEKSGMIVSGAKANFVVFRARNYSELFSRSQHDRVVIRDGVRITAALPDYEKLY
jgi:cytosine deaminase